MSCVLVFAVVLALYHLLRFLVSRNRKLRIWLEGKPVEVVKDGEICKDTIANETSSMQEVFMLLRAKSVSHLGQVSSALLEPDGGLSIYYFADEEVKYGLPVIPACYEHPLEIIPGEDYYSCNNCSHTTVLHAGPPPACKVCDKRKWVHANKEKRIT